MQKISTQNLNINLFSIIYLLKTYSLWEFENQGSEYAQAKFYKIIGSKKAPWKYSERSALSFVCKNKVNILNYFIYEWTGVEGWYALSLPLLIAQLA